MTKTFTKIGAANIDSSKYNLPNSRVFREAWEVIDGDVITIDMDKARKLYRNRLRTLRESIFASLDVAYIRAQEANDTTELANIVAQKNLLRALPNNPMIDQAATPEELEKIPMPGISGSIMEVDAADFDIQERDKRAGIVEV